MNSTRVSVLKWLLPVLFAIYYGNVSFYSHVHVIDGTAISHSHPFSKSQGTDPHKHDTMEEVVLFHNLSSLQIGDGAVHFLSIDKYIPDSYNLIISSNLHDFLSIVCEKISPRAPPIV